jgi:hypothetical protein
VITPRLVALAAVALFARPSLAVPPSKRWYTIETPHFRVHFHEGTGMYALAQRAARACEGAHERLVPKLRWDPARKTEVILSDDVDGANGSAFTLYRPWMRLNAEVPEDQSVLNDFADPLWNLVVHEYTHVLHLDTVGGLPALVDAVFGKLLLPNAYVPTWLTEGLATYEESNLSNSGRLRSSLFDMWLRESVLGGPFGIDEVSHTPMKWPRGNLAYLYGGHFLSYVAETVGEERVPDFFETYGARVIPFTLNEAAQEAWQRDFVGLYRDWIEDARGRYEVQLAPVRGAGVTPFRVLTAAGYGTGQPHLTRDAASIVYLEAGPDRRAGIRRMRADGTADRLIASLWASGPMDLSPDDRSIAIALPEVFEQYAIVEDLYEIEIATGRLTRLTRGLRATDPAWAPDGKSLAFVGRSGAGSTYLGVLDRASGAITRLLDAPFTERIYTPEFSPDGAAIVFAQQSGTGRRLVALDLASGERRTVLDSDAVLLQPTFRDERTILFSSDRTGIYNLHEVDLDTGALRQVTNVTSGAFQPSAPRGGAHIAFASYSSRGYDVAIASREDLFRGWLGDRSPRPPPPWTYDPREASPVREYRPLETLAPLYWLPLAGMDPLGVAVGAITGGADILGRHAYSVQAYYGLASREPGLFASYSNRTFHPGLDAYAQTAIAPAAGFPPGFYDRQWAVGVGTSFPFSSLDRFAAVGVGYELRYFDPRFVVSYQPDSLRPTIPRRGTTAVVSGSFFFSNARGYADSVSAEEGHALAVIARHSSRYTGGTFAFTSGEARYQTYLRMPWLEHHVVALQLTGGAAGGDLGARAVYALGGSSLADPILQLVRGQYGSPTLRGYPPGALFGNAFALGTLEYRFPIAIVDEGIDTLPIYLRRIHGAAFADAGTVADQPFRYATPKASAGVEVRAEITLGYALTTTARLGIAQGLSNGGVTQPYLTLGASF